MNEPRRLRSPNYPALSLPEAIGRVEVVFERERQHPMSKDVALKGLGYSSANGAALGTLSAVVKYGLLEKSGDSYRVTPRAVAILHPNSEAEKSEAIRAAAFAPALFAELAEQFPGGQVSDDNLRSYLIRNDFSSGAVAGVISAFRETMAMVSFEPAKTPALPAPGAVAATPNRSVSASMNAVVSIPATTTPASAWVLSTDGQSLTVSAQLDNAEAVDKLIRVLEANKLLLPAKAKREHQESQAGDDETAH